MSRPLRLAIVHYHLKRGGVTRVIESTLRGLAGAESPPQCVVLSGEVPAGPGFAGETVCLPELHYSNTRERDPDPAALARSMREAAAAALGGPPDLWHIHNHSLGKNGAFSGAVNHLAESGEALLLQMHDFAEDGRPENYRLIESNSGTSTLYPSGPRIHYAVLNGRDLGHFLKTGLDESRVHLLPNPVEAPTPAAADPDASPKLLDRLGADRLLLYPVRAVRRKNLGELLLWAALADKGTVFATTLGPTNRNFAAPYERWQTFARSLDLPAHLGICDTDDFDFSALMANASAIASTSIAEGFGLGFLEPWLYGKPVCGRDLPEITGDFKGCGIALDHLYGKLFVPDSWIQMDRLLASIRSRLEESYRAYGKVIPSDAFEAALRGISDGEGRIDFGGLDEAMQEAVIRHIAANPEAAGEMEPPALSYEAGPALIDKNRTIIEEQYSVDRYARKLHRLYETIASEKQDGVEHLPAASLLDSFMDPSRFRLLRT